MSGIKHIEKVFATSKQRNQSALITYITGGYPTAQDTPGILLAMQEAGADMLELGVPYSDPFADGPTIQHAHEVAIQNGTQNALDCLQMVSTARNMGLTVPVILMGYYEGFLEYTGGINKLCQDAALHGADGFLAVGIPDESSEVSFAVSCHKNGISSIPLVLPDSNQDRIKDLINMTSSFLYIVLFKGKTGARTSLPENLDETVARVRVKTDLPLAVGFGISTPEMVEGVSNLCDGAIIGSSITNHLNSAAQTSTEERAGAIREYVALLSTGSQQSTSAKNQATRFSQVPLCATKRERRLNNRAVSQQLPSDGAPPQHRAVRVRRHTIQTFNYTNTTMHE